MTTDARPLPSLADLAALEHEPGLVALAYEPARWVLGLSEDARAGVVGLVLCLFVAVRGGSTRLGLVGAGPGTWPDQARALGLAPPVLEAIGRVVEVLLGDAPHPLRGVIGAGDRPFVLLEGGWLSTQALAGAERSVEDALRARLDAQAPAGATRVDEILARLDLAPAPLGAGIWAPLVGAQRRAVAHALAHKFTVITGGPGTGKTTIAVAIVRGLAALGVPPARIALAAPTGKAQDRLRRAVESALESVATPLSTDLALLDAGVKASTLHRLLELGRRRENSDPGGTLPLDALIVDEASMVDLRLMEQVLLAVGPDARLVVLGDGDQLPSVEAGAVLRDWVERSDVRDAVVELTESHRMRVDDPDGAAIYGAAQAVRRGDRAVVDALQVASTTDELLHRGVEWLPTTLPRAFAAAWAARHLDLALHRDAERPFRVEQGVVADADRGRAERLLSGFERARVLTVTRGGLGVERMNLVLREAVRAGTRSLHLRAAQALRVGEPVLVEENLHGLGLYNGDFGVVAIASEAGLPDTAVVLFRGTGGEVRAVTLPAVRSALSLAYAMTVHKAQGSEYDAVALILPARAVPIWTREILYTALTRARRSAIVVGPKRLLEEGIARRLERVTGGASLRGADPAGTGSHE